MLNVCSLIFVISAIVFQAESLNSEKCKILPRVDYCLIESATAERWPHTERYAFDWFTQKCFMIRWSSYCPAPSGDVNNFHSEGACRDGCSGWA